MWTGRNWLFSLSLLLLFLLICFWPLGFNADHDKWQRQQRVLNCQQHGMDDPPKAMDGLCSADEIALLPDGPRRDKRIANKLLGAIVRDDTEAVEQLLQRYGDKHVLATIVSQADAKEPVTSAALLFNRLDILKVLAAHRLDQRSANGLSLLDNAVKFGYVEAAEWFLEQGVQSLLPALEGAKDTPTPLHLAASYGNRPMVEMLLAKGLWGVNARGEWHGLTPLHCLALGKVEILEGALRKIQ